MGTEKAVYAISLFLQDRRTNTMGFDNTWESMTDPQDCWPEEAEKMYKRVAPVGRGSFGLVWMARRRKPVADKDDDEYVAMKNITIKDKKGKVFAQREISILSELRHPNVIRLIRAFPIHLDGMNETRLVVMQLARGPDLQALVSARGALGIPLVRFIARQLVAAVSYLHGRAVLHRDIKPANCILENTQISPQDDYIWEDDDDLWSNGESAERQVRSNKWNLLLVDFGFARALSKNEISERSKHLGNSIVNESQSMMDAAKVVSEIDEAGETNNETMKNSLSGRATKTEMLPAGYVQGEEWLTGDQGASSRRRYSGVSETVVPVQGKVVRRPSGGLFRSRVSRRASSARVKMRSMSALGTKAFAAPEIRHDLREKRQSDITKSNEALTSCVADYGMIVDAYSVGWTLRVIITGVPPNMTISEYLHKLAMKEAVVETSCCGRHMPPVPAKIVRDTSDVPDDAASLIRALTMPKPEERMTVREAQNEPWIQGNKNEESYILPQGDHPSRHGDSVVPLECAEILQNHAELSMTELP